MKLKLSLLSGIFCLSCVAGAQAQIFFENPVGITGSSSQLAINGKYVDAVGANGFQDNQPGSAGGAAITIGDTTFNPIFTNSGITLSSPTGIGGGSDGSGSVATPFLNVLDDVAYVGDFNPADVETGTVTLNNLKVGHYYQVQIFDDGGFLSKFNGADSVTLQHQYVIGTFQATGLGLFTSQTFTFDSSLSGISEINAIALREVPEPSTYAMLLGGLGALFLIGRRRAKQTV